MKKILIIDCNTSVPVQLNNKFHEIITLYNTTDLLKVTNTDVSNQEAVESFNSDLKKFLNKEYVQLVGKTEYKKFNISRDTFIQLLREVPEYTEFIANKYNVDVYYIDALLTELSQITVKARYEREWRDNEKYTILSKELAEIQHIFVNFKKANSNDFHEYAQQVIDTLGIIGFNYHGSLFQDVKNILFRCEDIINGYQKLLETLTKFSDLDTLDLKELRNTLKNPKLFDTLSRKVNLYRTLSVLPKIINLEANDYLVVGEEPAKVIARFNNLGLRNSTKWFQLLLLDVCKTGTGANIVFIRTLSGAQTNIKKMAYFFDPKFAEPLVPERPKNLRVITTSTEAIDTLTRLISMPEGQQFGFDYETNGEDIKSSRFEMIGWSISNTNTAVYFDIRYIKLLEGISRYNNVLSYLKQFLDKHASRDSKSKTWVYNQSFELNVSYKLFKVFYEFWDYVVYSTIVGENQDFRSLKYQAQRDLRIRSWDDMYDGIMGIIHNWLMEEDQSKSTPKKKVFKERNDRNYFIKQLNNCNNNDIANFKDKFIWLYDNGYNTPFTCIPSELIGTYGALDSYFTVQGAKINQGKYDDRCERTFMDNIRLSSRLTGIYRDEKLYDEYLDLSKRMFSYAVFHLGRFDKANQIKLLLENSNVFKSVDDCYSYVKSLCLNEFTYWVLTHNVEFKSKPRHGRSILEYFRNNQYENGLNINLLNSELPNDIVQLILSQASSIQGWASDITEEEEQTELTVEDSEEGNLPNIIQIDGELIKQLSIKLGESLFPLLKFNKGEHLDEALSIIRLDFSLNELNSSSIMKMDYNEFMRSNLFTIRMTDFTLDKLFCTIGKYYAVTSPFVYRDTFIRASKVYPKEYHVLATFDKFDPDDKFNYRKDLTDKYLPFKSFDDIINKVNEIWDTDQGIDKVIINEYGKNVKTHLTVRDSHLAGILQPKKDADYAQAKRYYYINSDEYTGEYCESCVLELMDKIININKQPLIKEGNPILMTALGAMAKRFTKMISNYFNGVYKGGEKFQSNADENLFSFTEGNTRRVYPKYLVNKKTTKRWSSGIHVIFGKSTSKRVFIAPQNYLVSYFDISSAEVRSAAYMSGDPQLISEFEAGLDPYIELAKIKHGKDASMSLLKKERKKFKTCLLAQLYGQSANGLGIRLRIPESEAQDIIIQLRSHLPVLFKWIERKMNYGAVNRQVETFLGDTLYINEFDLGRLKRAGVNYAVQGNTAAILAHGFYNLIRESDRRNLGIQPFITVHDSCINYVPIKELPYLNEFYYDHFTEYIRKETGIVYTFDTMIGNDYTVACVLGNDGNGGVTLSGNDYALNDIVNKIGLDHIITDEKWDLKPDLSSPIYDLMHNFDNASFGSCKKESTINFKLVNM